LTTVGLFTIIRAIWLWRADPRRWMPAGLIALAAGSRSLLGGMTVIFMLPKPASISHACLARSFHYGLIALFTSAEWGRELMAEDSGALYMRWRQPPMCPAEWPWARRRDIALGACLTWSARA
jgi:heme A synthase